MINRLEIEVRSTELDALGHVNNAKYLEYLEWGRFEWVKESAAPVDWFGQSGLSTVLVNVNVNYRREATLGERLVVHSWLADMGRRSFRIGQKITNAAGETVCDATITSVMFDLATRASVPIPDDLRKAFEGLLRAEVR